jgi:hypothetical protein
MLWRTERSRLDSFKPCLANDLLNLFLPLYTLLSCAEPASQKPIIHKILYKTFTLPLDTQNKVDSAFEQSLAISMLASEIESYHSANFMRNLLARVQQTCFSVFAHTTFNGVDVDYTTESQLVDEDNKNPKDDDNSTNVQVMGEQEKAVVEMQVIKGNEAVLAATSSKSGLDAQEAPLRCDVAQLFEF